MRESAVVKHLKKVVAEMRGTTRKVKWEGRKHAPDLLILLPLTSCWVETKAPKKGATLGQQREHARLRASGMKVFVLDSVEAVDEWRHEIVGRQIAQAEARNEFMAGVQKRMFGKGKTNG